MSGFDGFRGPARLRGFIGLLIVVAFGALTAFAASPVSRWLLEQEVRDGSASWAAHIFDEIEDGATAADGGAPGSYADLAGALEAALRAGVVNRVSIRNRACGCVIAIDAAAVATGGADLAGRLRAFFPGDAMDHRGHDHSGADQSGATTSAGDATPEVRFTKGAFPGDPHDAADVTFLRRIGPDAYEL
ncbi:MAG: hypothetical protein KJO42_09805, partial [Silicimonas sp.]|nr:hypothetical protein [Silicimonas sp.]